MLQVIKTAIARTSKMSTITPLHSVNVPTEKATFALGCFWGPDALFGATLGVIRTCVGFTGGAASHTPTYKNLADHTEAILIDYDPTIITYEQLLSLFWENHDPTQHATKQYTSIIFYHNDEQKSSAEKTRSERQEKHKCRIVTTVEPASKFHSAEDYHQKYRLQQHPYLMKELGLKRDIEQLSNSFVAARLNGYVVGCGGVKQFDEECGKLGLSNDVKNYVRQLVIKHEGHGLFC